MENAYIARAADLTAVADAIRAKGETSESLIFPAGFVSAIEGIRGGAELNFEIVGGETEPVSPVENTIWVNTNVPINGWGFGSETNRPESAVTGMVWFSATNGGMNQFNALNENAIILSIIKAFQYTGSAWAEKSAQIYQDGSWRELFSYIFKDGIVFAGGDWPCTISNGYLTQQISIPSSASKIYTHSKSINLSGFKTATFVIQSSSPIYTNTEVGIYNQSGNGSNIQPVAYKRADNYSYNTDTTFVVDVPSGISSGYLGFGVNRQGSGGQTTTLKVRSILLE